MRDQTDGENKMKQRTEEVRQALKGGEPKKVMIAVYLPDKCLQRAFNLDLPRKLKSLVLSRILGPSSPKNPGTEGEWGEIWSDISNE